MITIQNTKFCTMPADSTTPHKYHGGITPIAPGLNTISTQGKKTLKKSKKILIHP
jgi:hypothetical protein